MRTSSWAGEGIDERAKGMSSSLRKDAVAFGRACIPRLLRCRRRRVIGLSTGWHAGEEMVDVVVTSVCDIVMPVFNAARTVRDAATSILAQTVTDIRLIIVDDGSEETCAKILRELASEDERVQLIRQPNMGIVGALNVGLAQTTAPIVARMDADDLAYSYRIERQLAAFEADPSLVATSGSVMHMTESGRLTVRYVPPSPQHTNLAACPSLEPYLIHPFLAARRSALISVGGYRLVHHAEDTDLYWRLAEIGRLDNLPDVLGAYRLSAESISGGSIINGRIAAVHSQLAALSAVRRASGVADMDFTVALSSYKYATTLPRILDVAGANLDEPERTWLRRASAAKLMELAAYRPWTLESSDIAFIAAERSRLANSRISESMSTFRYLIKRTMGLLVAQGRVRDAATLGGLKALPEATARAIKYTALARRKSSE